MTRTFTYCEKCDRKIEKGETTYTEQLDRNMGIDGVFYPFRIIVRKHDILRIGQTFCKECFVDLMIAIASKILKDYGGDRYQELWENLKKFLKWEQAATEWNIQQALSSGAESLVMVDRAKLHQVKKIQREMADQENKTEHGGFETSFPKWGWL